MYDVIEYVSDYSRNYYVIADKILAVRQGNMLKVMVVEEVEHQSCTVVRQTQRW
jgi:hypothetical protein